MTGKVKSIFITFRPRNGIINSDVTKYVEKLKNESYLGSYIILEKDGLERHIHSIVWFKNPVAMRDNRRKYERMYRSDWNSRDGSLWPVACRQKQVYNDDLYKNYLLGQMDPDGNPKGDKCEVVMDDVPPEADRLLCYSDPPLKQESGDARYQKMMRMFWIWKEEKHLLLDVLEEFLLMDLMAMGIDNDKRLFVSYNLCGHFIVDSIFGKKTMYVPADKRKIKNMNFNLFNYLTSGVYFDQSMQGDFDCEKLFPCVVHH